MYVYRRMTPKQRQDVLAYRKLAERPLHAPPHFSDGLHSYLLTAANYEHQSIMATAARRQEMQEKLLAAVSSGAEVFAWCVLPNHWHVLTRCDLDTVRLAIGRVHNGLSTQWNREDNRPGRKVWHRFADRRIRGDAHYWATVNYIHANPVRHKHAVRADAWPTSSVHPYLGELGREKLVQLWHQYPVKDYGKGWDW